MNLLVLFFNNRIDSAAMDSALHPRRLQPPGAYHSK